MSGYSSMLENHFKHMGKSGLAKDIYPMRQKGGSGGNIGGRQPSFRSRAVYPIMTGSGISPVQMDMVQAESEIKTKKKQAGLPVGNKPSKRKHRSQSVATALAGRRKRKKSKSASRSTSSGGRRKGRRRRKGKKRKGKRKGKRSSSRSSKSQKFFAKQLKKRKKKKKKK